MTNEMRGNNAVLDTSALFDLFQERKGGFGDIYKALTTIFPERKIKNILILDSVYDEVEKIKKGNSDRAKKAIEIYSKIGKALEENDIVKYSDVERHPNGVDDSLIDYCIANDEVFISFDTRTNIRYRAKSGKMDLKKVTLDQIKSVMELNRKLDALTEGNLYVFFQNMFDSKFVTPIEYIRVSKEERFFKLVDFIVNETLKNEDPDFVKKIKLGISSLKEGEIGDNLLNKNLIKLRGYNFGHLEIEEESLKDKYRVLINRFLEEKNYLSFEELVKYNPFCTEKELVAGILKYYGIGVENANREQ